MTCVRGGSRGVGQEREALCGQPAARTRHMEWAEAVPQCRCNGQPPAVADDFVCAWRAALCMLRFCWRGTRSGARGGGGRPAGPGRPPAPPPPPPAARGGRGRGRGRAGAAPELPLLSQLSNGRIKHGHIGQCQKGVAVDKWPWPG